MKSFFVNLLDLLYENSCLICNSYSGSHIVCNACEKSFVVRTDNHIKYFQEIVVYSWGLYDGKLRQGIINLKNGKKKLANYFSKILTGFWNTLPDVCKNKNYQVINTPSHKKRIKERGYCQSSLIGMSFAENLGFNFNPYLVVRKKETLYMNSLVNVRERQRNIKDAFEVVSSLSNDKKDILIIDDILTSGSTMCELAKTIKRKYLDVNLVGLTIASGDTIL